MFYLYLSDDLVMDHPFYSHENFWILCWEATKQAEVSKKDVYIVYDNAILARATRHGGVYMMNQEGKEVDINQVTWLRQAG